MSKFLPPGYRKRRLQSRRFVAYFGETYDKLSEIQETYVFRLENVSDWVQFRHFIGQFTVNSQCLG